MHSATPRVWNPLSALVSSSAPAVLFGLLSALACNEYDSELVEGSSDEPGGRAVGVGGLSGPGSGLGGGSLPIGGSTGVPTGGGDPGIGGTHSNPGGAGNVDGGSPAGGSGSLSGAGGTAGWSVAGSGGAPVAGAGDLLDGFEDQDITIEQTAGRGGVWYLFDDGTAGSVGPDPLVLAANVAAPPELGGFALRVTASGFTGFGSGVGADFRAGKKVYDASQFGGLRFWARVGVGKNANHRVQISDGSTEAQGGKCNPAATEPNGEMCDDHFGINETFTTVWTPYSFAFADLAQVGWGLPADAIDKSKLYGLQVTSKARLDVELWLDQIEFF